MKEEKCKLAPIYNGSFRNAIREGNLEVVRNFVENGVHVNTSTSGFTHLMDACSSGHLEIVKYLVEKGAILEPKTHHNFWTPLMMASKNGYVDIVRFLLENGAEPNFQSRHGDTALTMVKQGNTFQVISITQLLLDADCDIDAMNNRGRTAVSNAASCGKLELVKYLVENGANIEKHGVNRRRTTLDIAVMNGYLDIARFLLSKSNLKKYVIPKVAMGAWDKQGEIQTIFKDYFEKQIQKRFFQIVLSLAQLISVLELITIFEASLNEEEQKYVPSHDWLWKVGKIVKDKVNDN